MSAINLTNKEYQENLKGSKPVLVDFWAPWCTYCRRISAAYDRVAEQYGDKVVVSKINVDEEPGLAEQLQIEVIPTLVWFKDGKPVADIVAPDSKAKIEAFIEENLTA